MTKFVFELAVQVTADIQKMFDLPCVYCVFKAPYEDGGVVYNIDGDMLHPYQKAMKRSCHDRGSYAVVGDWLCRDRNGKWIVLTNEEFATEEFNEI